MDKTKKEMIFSILEGLNSYNISDDTVFDEDHIGYQIDIARISLIKEESIAKKLGESYYQSQCCIEVECEAEGCDVPEIGFVKSGDITYYAELPGLISFIGYDNIKYLGGPGWNNPFYKVPFSTFVQGTTGIWTTGKPIFTEISGKVLFKNLPTDGLKYICLLGLLESPESSCEYDEEKPYPVSDPLKIEIIVIKNLLSRLGINYKEKNDASPDLQQQQQSKR
jgi:hypothetical protein